jgi:capsular polysaccharide export protein
MNNILIQCGDHFENQLRILPLAKWLKGHGYNPVIMVYREFNGTEFLKYGIDVISLNIKKRSKSSKQFKVRRNESKLSVNDIDYDAVMNSEFNKTPYLRLPKYRAKNEGKFVDTAIAIFEVIEEVRPDFIFVWNGYTGIVANFLRIYCEQFKIDCSYLERGFKKDSLYIDAQGVNGFGALSDTKQYSGSENKIVDLSSVKKVLVPLQVQTDTNIIYNSVIKTMREFVFYVREKFDDDVVLYVKTHPEEVDKNLNLPLLHNVDYIGACDLNELIKSVDLVVTINSTVGMSALFEGVPVVGLGKSIFSNKKLVIDKEQFDSEVTKFELDEVSLFRRDLYENYTFCGESPSQIVVDYFPLKNPCEPLNIFNSFDISPTSFLQNAEIATMILGDALECKTINVDVFLGSNDGLDLTYRTTNSEITLSWIEDRCRLAAGMNVAVLVNKIPQRKLSQGINIAFVHTNDFKGRNLKGYDFVVNEYFNLLPMCFVRKKARRMFYSFLK